MSQNFPPAGEFRVHASSVHSSVQKKRSRTPPRAQQPATRLPGPTKIVIHHPGRVAARRQEPQPAKPREAWQQAKPRQPSAPPLVFYNDQGAVTAGEGAQTAGSADANEDVIDKTLEKTLCTTAVEDRTM